MRVTAVAGETLPPGNFAVVGAVVVMEAVPSCTSAYSVVVVPAATVGLVLPLVVVVRTAYFPGKGRLFRC